VAAPRFRLVDTGAFERPVQFRFPFRFGAARVEAARQAFVCVRIAGADGREAEGWAAEMMMPRWFDKAPDLTPDQNTDQLRQTVHLALDHAPRDAATTAFDLHAGMEGAHHDRCAAAGLNGLIASFGLALLDRAVIDALGRLRGMPAVDLVRANLLGIDARTTPDLAGFDLPAFLATRDVASSIALRHTVGLGDALTAADVTQRLDDGLPETLEEVIAAHRPRWFKLKIAGDPGADVARLIRIAAVLDRAVPGYRATLDGNEQYRDAAQVLELLDRIDTTPQLSTLRDGLAFLEQPIARDAALTQPVHDLAARLPMVIDESDSAPDAFLTARRIGYTGISSKSCKGFYRGLLNAARVAQWQAEGAAVFMSAEDLTTQAGLGVQQDLILASLVGATHAERNGHHFVDGMGGSTEDEAQAFLLAHPDLYQAFDHSVRLRIRDGRLALGSIAAAAGLGSAALPEVASLTPLPRPEDLS
jgi:hypothetical protein